LFKSKNIFKFDFETRFLLKYSFFNFICYNRVRLSTACEDFEDPWSKATKAFEIGSTSYKETCVKANIGEILKAKNKNLRPVRF
jgi:hypothetical protein